MCAEKAELGDDVTARKLFESQHIPGARFVDLDALGDPTFSLAFVDVTPSPLVLTVHRTFILFSGHNLPTPEVFAQEAHRLGLHGMRSCMHERLFFNDVYKFLLATFDVFDN